MDSPGVVYEDSSSLEGTSVPPDNTPGPRRNRPMLRYALLTASIIILVLAGGLLSYVVLKGSEKKVAPATPITINTQNLDNGTLNKLTNIAGPGESKQQLTISPDTLFKSGVDVQGNLNVSKNGTVGGNLNVTGASTMQGAVAINSSLAVRGGLSVGGAVTAASINVGSLAISTVNISGNVNFGGHIIPTGTAPASKPSLAASGGTATISGNDTAGTITINIGGGTPQTGELAIISFKSQFSTTPKVQLTPVNSAASSLDYYITRSPTFFTVNTSNVTSAGASYVFDYLVTQ